MLELFSAPIRWFAGCHAFAAGKGYLSLDGYTGGESMKTAASTLSPPKVSDSPRPTSRPSHSFPIRFNASAAAARTPCASSCNSSVTTGTAAPAFAPNLPSMCSASTRSCA